MPFDTKHEQDNHTQRWPDNAPSVAIELSVGKKHDVQVDPELLISALTKVGAPPDSLQDVTIEIFRGTPMRVEGAYYPCTQHITVSHKNPVKYLLREGTFFAQHATGQDTPEAREFVNTRQSKAKKVGSIAGLAATAGIELISGMDADLIDYGIMYLIGGAIGSSTGYYRSPLVKSAYDNMTDAPMAASHKGAIIVSRR